ncbi:MAG TPA: hypothetical protein VFZ00_33860, partial [Solirubrobacter sp.]|nr:hypothetical protein [Solirubrobacter sp.]
PVRVDARGTELHVDPAKDAEYQTDKAQVKLVPCRECSRPLVVTTFFAPAKAVCAACSGQARAVGDHHAAVGQPKPGETDPAKAVNLADCLINEHFAIAVCPAHPDDPEHEMELKSVSHSDSYGPGHYERSGGSTIWVQDAKGEVVTHQCRRCLAVVTYNTTIRTEYARQNEPRDKPDTGAPERHWLHGLREPAPEAA